MLQAIWNASKKIWNYGSGEVNDAAARNRLNNDDIDNGSDALDGRYLRPDASLNRPQGKSIFDRKVSDFDKATHQIELINRIFNADSGEQLDQLQSDVNNAGFDQKNRKIVEGHLQERRESLGRSQSA